MRSAIIGLITVAAAASITGCSATEVRERNAGEAAADVEDRRWVRFGRQRVDAESETLVLRRYEQKARELMFVVERGPVDVRGITVKFADGSTFSPQLRKVDDYGVPAFEVALPADRGDVRAVMVDSRKPRSSDYAQLEIWGR